MVSKPPLLTDTEKFLIIMSALGLITIFLGSISP